MSAIGLAAGPILGGLILNSTSAWGWIFYINVPIVVLGQVLIRRSVSESRDPEAPPIDTVGAAALADRPLRPLLRLDRRA